MLLCEGKGSLVAEKEGSMKDMYDVAIVGAGPAGSAAAHYLAKGGLDVLLLDKFNFPRDKTCGDGLTPRALRVLDEMDILDELLRVGYRLNEMEFIAPKGHSVVAPVPKKDGKTDCVYCPPLHPRQCNSPAGGGQRGTVREPGSRE